MRINPLVESRQNVHSQYENQLGFAAKLATEHLQRIHGPGGPRTTQFDVRNIEIPMALNGQTQHLLAVVSRGGWLSRLEAGIAGRDEEHPVQSGIIHSPVGNLQVAPVHRIEGTAEDSYPAQNHSTSTSPMRMVSPTSIPSSISLSAIPVRRISRQSCSSTLWSRVSASALSRSSRSDSTT